jgi:hypothetical protein
MRGRSVRDAARHVSIIAARSHRASRRRPGRIQEEDQVAKIATEFDVTCPCCRATLVIDTALKRVVRHAEPERADKPKLDEAHRILAEERARRESLFEQSVQSERTRGDALSKRFEEALKQAREEPVSKPSRDFDLD